MSKRKERGSATVRVTDDDTGMLLVSERLTPLGWVVDAGSLVDVYVTDISDTEVQYNFVRRPLSDCGHGWVYPRPVKARCGGPGICGDCRRDMEERDAARRH